MLNNSLFLKKNSNLQISIESEQQIEVPIKPIFSKAGGKTYCQTHSTRIKLEEITYFNTLFLTKGSHSSNQTIFLCQKCVDQMKSKSSGKQIPNHIISKQKYREKFIQSILYKYTQGKNRQQAEQVRTSLKLTQQNFNNQIQKFGNLITKRIDTFKKLFKDLISPFNCPIDKDQLLLFNQGKLNAGMLQKFHRKYLKYQNYKSLTGKQSTKVLHKSTQILKATLKDIEEQFVAMLNQNQKGIKLFIKNYQEIGEEEARMKDNNNKQEILSKSNGSNKQQILTRTQNSTKQTQKMIPQKLQKKTSAISQKSNRNQMKSQNVRPNQKKILSKINQKNQIKKVQKKRMRRDSQESFSSSDDSSSSSSDSSQNMKRPVIKNRQDAKKYIIKNYIKNGKKLPEDKQIKTHKTHTIKKRTQRPSKAQNVQLLNMYYLTKQKKSLAQYIIHHSYTEKVQVEREQIMPVQQFIKRYPMSYGRYYKNKQI